MITTGQLFLAVSIPTIVALLGILWNQAAIHRVNDRVDRVGDRVDRVAETINGKIDRQTENFNNQVTTLLNTIHDVNIRVVKLEEHSK